MFAETIVKNLVAIAEAYAAGQGKTLSNVSKEFYGQAAFFEELRAGSRSVRLDKAAEMLDRFRADWPDEVPWPSVRAALMTRNPPEARR